MDKKNLFRDELGLCLKLWQEQGYCTFGGHTRCAECAAPYIVWKLMTGEVMHASDGRRLTLQEWQERLKSW